MAKVNLNNLSAKELEKLAKDAREAAKKKRNKEKQEIINKLGKLMYRNIDPILASEDLDLGIRQSVAKIVSRELDTITNVQKESIKTAEKVEA